MSKKIFTFGILAVILAVVLIPTHAVYAAWYNPFSWLDSMVSSLFKAIALFMMGLSSLALIICGYLFDKVVTYTIIEMATHIGGASDVGKSISLAWATLRDLANMCFIFVLLFAAFKTMFELDFGNIGTTIRNIIIVALLINFSLFFSKVVIDASNIVAIGFYKSIATSQSTVSGGSGGGTAGGDFTGISAGYMNMLGLQTFFSAEFLKADIDPINVLMISFLSSVFMLITAVIFLIAGIMFATRFIILVFLMILSPLALIAYIIPGMGKHFDEWKSALINQSFFAPLYFALTWVVFKLGTALIGAQNAGGGALWANITTDPKSVMSLILNYVLIIGFSVAALIFAKQMATSGANVGKAFKTISGGMGAVAMGGAAMAGRSTVGRASSLISEKYRDKWSQSTTGRAGLWLADKGKKGSFDIRASDNLKKVGLEDGLGIMGKAGIAKGKGGFAGVVDRKAKSKAEYAKNVYGQTSAEKEKAGTLEGEHKGAEKTYNDAKTAEIERIQKERNEEAKRTKDELEKAKKASEAAKTSPETEEEMKKAEEEFNAKSTSTLEYAGKQEAIEAARVKLEEAKKAHAAALDKQKTDAETKLDEAKKAHESALEKQKTKIEEADYNDATKALGKEAADKKKEWEDARDIGKNRQISYAERLEHRSEKILGKTGAIVGGLAGIASGNYVGGKAMGATIGAGVGAAIGAKVAQGNAESARAVREQAKGKSGKDKVFDSLKDALKEDSGGTPAPAAPAPETPAPPESGGATT